MEHRGERKNEPSQLIDIAAMSALVERPQRPKQPALELQPNFAASRLTTSAATTPLANDRPSDPRAPLYWMIGCLNVVVLALAAYIAFDEPAVVVQERAAAAPVEPEAPEPVNVAAPGPERKAQPEAVPGAPKTDEVQEQTEPQTASKRRNRRGRRGKADKETPVAVKREPKSRSRTSDIPIDCIMDPKSCNRGKSGPDTAAQGPKRNRQEDLPDTLGRSQLRTGFGRVRSAAKACGPKFGASGSSVQVKVSIAGRSGQVTSARALGEHAKTGLGNCVASALKQASFDRFAKPQIGIKYTVRL